MQAVNFTPAVLPGVAEMLAPIPAPPGGTANTVGPLLAPLFEGVVPRLATEGDFALPPQPATSDPTTDSTSVNRPARTHRNVLHDSETTLNVA